RVRRDARLGNVVLGAFLHGGDRDFFVALTGQHHHRNERMLGANTFENFHAVATRQGIVKQHTGENVSLDARQSLLAMTRFADGVVAPGTFLQTATVKQPVVFAVVYHEYFRAPTHESCPWRAESLGSRAISNQYALRRLIASISPSKLTG